jgi:peptidoglycan DL-endopeptidase CwlO
VLVTYRPPRCARRESSRAVALRSRKRQAPAFVIAVAVLLAAAGSATADPSVSSKQSEARHVLAQIDRLDMSLERAVEAWNSANVKLAAIERDQKRARFELGVAKANLGHAQTALNARLVAIYTSESDTALEVILGSTSLDDLVNRIETVNRVSHQDARVMGEVKTFKRAVTQRQAELKRAHVSQAKVVAARAAARASIQSQLATRQSLLNSIRSEISRLQAQERARQAELAAQARARIPAQSAAAASSAAQNPLGVGAVSADGAATAAPPSRYGGVVGIAMRYLGTPYVWGGASPSGFDCSGFTMYVYAQVGVSLPHSSYAQYGMGVSVSRSQLQPGDLVFFYGLGHVGIYIGGGQYIHAPHTGDVVKISTIGSGYVGARRLL